MTKISFLHSGLPKDCTFPIISTLESAENYPFRHGTGFFAKRGRDIYFITARHCLIKHTNENIDKLASRLAIPYIPHGYKHEKSDYIQFSDIYSPKQKQNNSQEEYIDFVVLKISNPSKSKHLKTLLSRSVKIPPTGDWLDSFISIGQEKFGVLDGKSIKLLCIGYPYDGTITNITIDDNERANILLQPATFIGYLEEGIDWNLLSLSKITWECELNGFSGSPVFISFKNENGRQFALSGMLVMGTNSKVHFIKVSVISRFFQELYS
ncbi:hypothetical protein SAMN02949497_0011 [Methylomagnum ishizawai]|uniref:Trypsin-like peptidase domain-containing protein n=1 Tax=Methylomagnum ishizawai TaxID=1760988 RepID=A0A1Y6DE85_9GAMM|nr:hypothetical protein [Methylomagnum ishizawai]SMF97755.1 hypothetical protein SAMN02949497_0011 [Methylomagnum ishizawai]